MKISLNCSHFIGHIFKQDYLYCIKKLYGDTHVKNIMQKGSHLFDMSFSKTECEKIFTLFQIYACVGMHFVPAIYHRL